MHKALGAVVLVFVLTVSIVTVRAESEHGNSENSSNNGKSSPHETANNSSSGNKVNSKNEVEGQTENELEMEVGDEHKGSSPSAIATCAPEAQWKNHGDFVSCVAHLHQGGKTVSEAARSDTGKKHGTASGSIKPSASSNAIPITSGSFPPESTGSATTAALQEEVINILANIQSLLERLKHLFGR